VQQIRVAQVVVGQARHMGDPDAGLVEGGQLQFVRRIVDRRP